MKFNYCLQIDDNLRIYTTKRQAEILKRDFENRVPINPKYIFIFESKHSHYILSGHDLQEWYYINYPSGVHGHEVGRKGREWLISNLVNIFIERHINFFE